MFGKLNSISSKSEINKETSGEGESRSFLPSSQENLIHVHHFTAEGDVMAARECGPSSSGFTIIPG
jgi:hypothetical protein